MKTIYNINPGTALLAGLAFSLMIPGNAAAEQRQTNVNVAVRDIRQERDSIRTILEFDINGMSLSRRSQLYLFPIIKADTNECKLAPIVINGRTQQSVVNRAEKLSGKKEPVYASFSTKGRKNFHENIPYSVAVEGQEWMKDAQVAMAQEIRNCRGDFHRVSMEIIADSIRFIKKPVRDFIFAPPVKFLVPPREEIKNRSEAGEAQIIYTVGSSEIKPALGNNQNELYKIQRSIEEVKNVEGVNINSITISSYASPEGAEKSNLTLSEKRATSLSTWISRNYDLRNITFSSRGYGEDWDRMAELAEKDQLLSGNEKIDALNIIKSGTAFDAREQMLRQYNGGQTYRYIVENIYPQLRRSAYRIEFTVPEYSLETIKKVYNTNPKMLSLYEFYLLSNTYEPESREFREVIIKAASIFPDEKISRISMAVLNIQADNADAAAGYLEGLENDPQAWLLFSVVYARKGDLDKAEYYIKKATDDGNPDAAVYAKELMDYKKEEAKYQEELKEWQQYGME